MFCLFKSFISETRKYVFHISTCPTDICRFGVKRNVHSRDAGIHSLVNRAKSESTVWKNIGDIFREYPRLRRKSRTSGPVNSRTRRSRRRRGLNPVVREWNHRARIEPLIRGRLVALCSSRVFRPRFSGYMILPWLSTRLCHYSDNDRCGSSGRRNCSATMRRETTALGGQAAPSYLV